MRYDQDDNIQEFCVGLESVLKEAHGKSIVLVMGAENAGKNTFVNQLLGVQYSVQTNPRTRQDYFAMSERNQAMAVKKIGAMHHYMPELFDSEQDGMTYCVCPDLVSFEARDDEKEKLKVSLPMTLQAAIGIKSLVFLFNIKTLQNSRGIEFRRLVASFVKLFKNEDFIYSNRDDMPSVFYVFTKVERDINIDDIIVTMYELLSTIDAELCELKRLKSELVSAQNEADDESEYAQKIIENNASSMAKEAEKRMILAVVSDINRIFISYCDANIYDELQVLKRNLMISSVVHSSHLLNNIDIRDTFLNKHLENMIKLKNDWGRYHSELKLLRETKELNETMNSVNVGTLQNRKECLDKLNGKKVDNRIERQRLVASCRILDTDEEIEHRMMEEKIEMAAFNEAIISIAVYLIQMGMNVAAGHLPPAQVLAAGPARNLVLNAISRFVLNNLPIQVKLLKYDDIPFCRIVKSTTEGTEFNNDEVSIPEQGKYSISYSPLTDGTATVKVYVHKKILYADNIKAIKEEMDALDRMYDTYTKEINSASSDPPFYYDANKISEVVQKCTRDILDIENKLGNMLLQHAAYVRSVYMLSNICAHVTEFSDLQSYSKRNAINLGVLTDELDRALDETKEAAMIFGRR